MKDGREVRERIPLRAGMMVSVSSRRDVKNAAKTETAPTKYCSIYT